MGGKWGNKYSIDMHVYEGEKEVSSDRGPIGPITSGAYIKPVKHDESSYIIGAKRV
jgi:hypothetical protein